MSVKIAVDSAFDISVSEAKQMGVDLISLIVGFGDDEYLDGVAFFCKNKTN